MTPDDFSRAFRSWRSMLDRCIDPAATPYRYYGGRGIVVCDRWYDFRNFLSDMGGRPAGTSLDRIDVNGNYEQGNCRWASSRQQMRNTRRNVSVSVDNTQMLQVDAARLLGVAESTVMRRRLAGRPLAVKRGPKLDDVAADEIRQYIDYGLHDSEIAGAFGISRQAVGNIRRGAAWAKPELIEDFDE